MYLHYAFDITERKRTENEIKEKTEQLDSLYETGKKITSIVSKDELLPWIAEQAASLLDTDACHYRIRKGNYLVKAAGTKEGSEMMHREKIRIGESISGTIAKEKKPIIVEDLRKDPRLIEEHREAAQKHNFTSCLGVPMIAGNDVIGVILVNTRKPREFNKKDAELLSSFADMAAIAIKNADLFESLEDARNRLEKSEKNVREFSGKVLSIREEEKKRLAADLHDELASMVVALEMNLSIAEKNVQKNDLDSAVENINKSRNLLKSAAGNLRNIVKKLRPPNLDINGLPEALKEYFSDVNEQMKINIDFDASTNGKKFNDETSIVLFRVAQESVNNVIKHAHAKNIKIKLCSENGHINFFVYDNGKGFDTKTSPQKRGSLFRMGIMGMRERVESLGGTFDIKSEPNKGTEISVTIPNKEGK